MFRTNDLRIGALAMANGIFAIPTPKNEPVLSYGPTTIEKQAIKEELKRQSAEQVEIPIVINGKKITTGDIKTVVSPHNKSHIVAHCHQASEKEVQAAVDSSLAIRQEWSRLPWHERAAVFLKAADLLAGKFRAEMNAATMLGQSKTIHQAEIDAACELIDFLRFNAFYMQKIYEEQPSSSAGQWNRLAARGLEGFVFAVTPFNFTSIAVNLPCAPALMGCTALWKPAATSVLSSYIGFKILQEAGLPEGVINFIPGHAPTISEILLNHPELSGIHFTGSTATFQLLWQKVGQNIAKYKTYPRLVGETGGKDFIFAHPSANPQELVTALVRGAFEYQGQKCSAASRAYIPESLWKKVKDPLLQTTESIKMGDVSDFTNFMGAVIDDKAFKKITGYIDRAKASAKTEILVGGDYSDEHGYFVRPTIIQSKDPNYESMVEEIFGPVLSIFVYPDNQYEQTIESCESASPYALTGAIFAQDRRVIHELSQRFEHTAGNFYINDKPTGAVVGQQPFGGSRASGTNDKAGSIYNLLRWVSLRTMKETFEPPTDYRYPFMKES